MVQNGNAKNMEVELQEQRTEKVAVKKSGKKKKQALRVDDNQKNADNGNWEDESFDASWSGAEEEKGQKKIKVKKFKKVKKKKIKKKGNMENVLKPNEKEEELIVGVAV